MKKLFLCLALLSLFFILAACDVPQSEYNKIVASESAILADYVSLKAEFEDLRKEATDKLNQSDAEISTALAQTETARAETAALQSKYDALLSEYEKFKAEIADRDATAEEGRAIAELDSVSLGVVWDSYDSGVTYSQLSKKPGDYTEKKLRYSGKIIQIIKGLDTVNLRIALNDDYKTVILASYETEAMEYTAAMNDLVTIYGIYDGMHSYKATDGGTVTLHKINVDKIELTTSE